MLAFDILCMGRGRLAYSMLTLKRDPEICKKYIHDAVSALCEYNKVAVEKNAEFETEIINERLDTEERWHPLLSDITEMLRKGTNTAALAPEQLEALEKSDEGSKAKKMQSRPRKGEGRKRRKRKSEGHIRTETPMTSVIPERPQ